MTSIMRYYCYLLRRHLVSWRIFAVLIVTLLTMDAFFMPIRSYCQNLEIKMSQWGFALLWNNKYISLCFILIFVFASAIFPENKARDRYVITRIGVSKWTLGQALYLITFGWLYTLVICLCMNLLLINVIEFSPDWGLGWGTLINDNVIAEFNIYTTVPYLIISNYTPLYANILVIFIMGLLLGMLSMLMLCLNFYSKIAGPVVTSAIVFLDMAANKNTRLLKYSPVSWIRLDSHYKIMNTDQPTVIYIIGMLSLLTLLFLMLAKITANRTQENGRRKA